MGAGFLCELSELVLSVVLLRMKVEDLIESAFQLHTSLPINQNPLIVIVHVVMVLIALLHRHGDELEVVVLDMSLLLDK